MDILRRNLRNGLGSNFCKQSDCFKSPESPKSPPGKENVITNPEKEPKENLKENKEEPKKKPDIAKKKPKSRPKPSPKKDFVKIDPTKKKPKITDKIPNKNPNKNPIKPLKNQDKTKLKDELPKTKATPIIPKNVSPEFVTTTPPPSSSDKDYLEKLKSILNNNDSDLSLIYALVPKSEVQNYQNQIPFEGPDSRNGNFLYVNNQINIIE